MEIIIGKPVDLRLLEQSNKRKSLKTGEVKANILVSRSSRKSPMVLKKGLRDRRTKRVLKDPDTSRVLTLLIENANFLPEDIETGNYTITLKFTKD